MVWNKLQEQLSNIFCCPRAGYVYSLFALANYKNSNGGLCCCYQFFSMRWLWMHILKVFHCCVFRQCFAGICVLIFVWFTPCLPALQYMCKHGWCWGNSLVWEATTKHQLFLKTSPAAIERFRLAILSVTRICRTYVLNCFPFTCLTILGIILSWVSLYFMKCELGEYG